MAASSQVSPELSGELEAVDEKKKKEEEDYVGSEPSEKVQNERTEDGGCNDEMDTSIDDGKVLAKALKVARNLSSRGDPISGERAVVSGPLLDMFTEISASPVPIRSQQKGEPEFSPEQKMSMLLDLYHTKPLVFLERFRKVLKEEHLQCFRHLSGDYTADFYFKEIRKDSLKKVHHTKVRNKRYAALQQLISESELQSEEEREVDNEEKALMREEFISRMHQRFLDGKDRDFDYSEVDDNPDFDNLDIVNRDEEERYFDDDKDEGIDEMEAEEDERVKGQVKDGSE
ncbi:hypothetical protein GDO81_019748 [Engystomops pustulosus]|uniref:CCD97-like C-terminal domain-containing protein n=1 Tax=Engystomops pustulosus TaxID=76066 RepID=A0AAV6YYI8_ENGPU|nr:hypothetical protein GDO81_019748 [Engystomops pustulosus]